MHSKKTNHLINEKSPYLLQHASNPVDWYPWSSEAFKKAQEEDKPIFLSIGYSTCHWCHVMAHESFEDADVASLLNSSFVSIKVDREERPDIDQIYMDVCQALTGRGGWPLTIIMTPDKKPFFAATYISKKGRFGSSGLLELLPAISDAWKNKRAELVSSADKIIQAIRDAAETTPGQALGKNILATAYTQLLRRFDPKDGGFSDAPKFPTPHILLFLLRYWKRTGADQALKMVETTLQVMRRGGIFDHIGFGFHRYSTDLFWLLPHFEKMLYDQALLALAYTEAYNATNKIEYQTTAREIFTYVLRDMTDSLGGFYSAEDADSADETGKTVEGKFYVWTEQELKSVLNSEDAEFISKIYNIKKGGNFLEQATQERTGENILHLTKPLSQLAMEFNNTEDQLRARLETLRSFLFEIRIKRAPPHKDDKILTDWNGLMIAALAKAAQIFDEPNYRLAAEKAVEFIYKNLIRPDGRLLHRYRDGEGAIPGNADDYAFLIWGLLELYETTFQSGYLRKALELNKIFYEQFWDSNSGGFYFTANDGEQLIVRRKEIYDGAIPSANAVAMLNLLRLEQITGRSEFGERAAQISAAFAGPVTRAPVGFTMLLNAVEFAISDSIQVTIAGDLDDQDTQQMLRALTDQYIPNKVVMLNPINEESPEIFELAEYLKDQPSIAGKATAYVCIKGFCKKPVSTVNDMLIALKSNNNST